jgi:acetyl-CoA carboxylase carboxyltransferase component
MIIGSDPVVPGGLAALKKVRRLGEIAAGNGLPRIHLLDGPEADTGPAADPAEAGPAHHQVLRDLAQAAAGKVPSIAVVLGRGTGAAAHLSRYSIAVRRLAGEAPVDFPAEDERDAIRLTRLCIRRLNPRRIDPEPTTPPKYDPDELLGLTPAEPREILARLLDGSGFEEFQARYGPGLVTGWGELHGYPVGVLAGAATDGDAPKAARFIARANAAGTPLLFLDSGELGEPTLIEAVATSAVPHLTVDVGGGTGLCGRAYRPRFLFSWPRSGALDRSGRLHDDGVLDPRDTRTALGIALSVATREAQ